VSGWREALYESVPIPVQNFLLSRFGERLRRARFNAEYRALRARMEELERSSPEAQEAYQAVRLAEVIRVAAEEVPYYREMFRELGLEPSAIRGPRDLPRLPLLHKETVRSRLDQLVSRRADPRRLRLAHTSGSTGQPLSCYWDGGVDLATNAVLWQHRSWAGFEFGRPYATILGRMIVPPGQKRPPYWRFNRPWNQLFLSSFHLDETTAPSYLQALRQFRPEALEAYPSTAYALACLLRSRGETLPLRAVFTSAETLLPIQREVIEERFACRVFDYFGAAERVLFAGECPAGSGMHCFTGYGVCEVTDEEGRPVPVGGTGHLTVTGLHNCAMPLIRYRIGDVSGIRKEPCACGRTLPLLQPVTTKAEDIVVTPEGRLISPSVLTHPFKPMKNILASQIVQEAPDRLVIRLVRRAAYTEADSEILLREFRRRLGPTIQLRIDFVETIPRGPGGKLRWVISKVPLRFGAGWTDNLFPEEDRTRAGVGPTGSGAPDGS
jgi:phenylacetate-CoA ligase